MISWEKKSNLCLVLRGVALNTDFYLYSHLVLNIVWFHYVSTLLTGLQIYCRSKINYIMSVFYFNISEN